MYSNIIIYVLCAYLKSGRLFFLGILTTKYALLHVVVAPLRKMGGQLPCILHIIGRPGLSAHSEWRREGLFYCRYFGDSVNDVFRSKLN